MFAFNIYSTFIQNIGFYLINNGLFRKMFLIGTEIGKQLFFKL